MLRKSLISNKPESGEPQQSGVLRPGDFELGSLESRGAARAMLEKRRSSKFRVHVSLIGKPFHLASSTCTRSLWPDGTVFELVQLSGSCDQLDRAQLDRIIAKLPIDGKKHTLAEVI
jgi:hypothetical protein